MKITITNLSDVVMGNKSSMTLVTAATQAKNPDERAELHAAVIAYEAELLGHKAVADSAAKVIDDAATPEERAQAKEAIRAARRSAKQKRNAEIDAEIARLQAEKAKE